MYKFETLKEFGYAKDPHTVFAIVQEELKKVSEYEVTDGLNNYVPKSEFRNFKSWSYKLRNEGEVYYELYGKYRFKEDRAQEMLGLIKVEKFTTID